MYKVSRPAAKGAKTNNAQDDIRQNARGDGITGEEEKEYEKGDQKHCPRGNKKEVSNSISFSQVSVIMVIVETRNQPTRNCELFRKIRSVRRDKKRV